jgi:hypothetical protein
MTSQNALCPNPIPIIVLISASAAQKFARRGQLYRVYFERSSILRNACYCHGIECAVITTGLSRRDGFRVGGGRLGIRRRRRSPAIGVSCFPTVSRITVRTRYMNTAPKTAPATAPPSFGSSSVPITVLLLDCVSVSLRNSVQCELRKKLYMTTRVERRAGLGEAYFK